MFDSVTVTVVSTVVLWAAQFLRAIGPFLVTIILGVFAWKLWRYYLLSIFVASRNWKLLEIKIPREVFKSPKAMELVLTAMWQTRQGPPMLRFRLNNRRPWYSLEITSDGGDIHFYIRTEEGYASLVTAALYANYPDIQVLEVPDYTHEITWDRPDSEWAFDAEEFGLAREDAYPITTYIDYGLDKDPKEEFKHDPLAQILEVFGSIPPDEKFWFQIVITAEKDNAWKEEGKKLVEKILERDKQREPGSFYFPPPLTKIEASTVEAIQRSIDKIAFRAGIRMFYWFKKGQETPDRDKMIFNSLNVFGSEHLNSIVRTKDLGYGFFFLDPFGIRDKQDRDSMYRGYVNRSWFWPPSNRGKWSIMTTEELATLFHVPGQVVGVPTLRRIESKRGEAPSNLPV